MKMNMRWIGIIIVVIAVLVFFLWIGMTYNSFIRLDEEIDAQWNEILNQNQRKMDLIPGLINLTEGYQQFEKSTLENVTRLRNQWLAATSDQERADISVDMSGYLSGLQVTFEAYPELQAVGPLRDVMDELAGTENRIAYARSVYIEDVREYNIAIKVFPSNMIAGMFGFEDRVNYFGSTPVM
jgi:LemA protein